MGVTNWHTLLFMSFSQSPRWGAKVDCFVAIWYWVKSWKMSFFFWKTHLILCFHLAFVQKKAQECKDSNTTCSLHSYVVWHYDWPRSSTSTVTFLRSKTQESGLDHELCFDMTEGIRFFISAGRLLASDRRSLRAGFVPTCLLWCRTQ